MPDAEAEDHHEQPVGRGNDHAGALQQVPHAVAGGAKVVVRRLVHFPLVRHDGQQRSRGRQRARDFAHHGFRLAHMFQRDDVDGGLEAAGSEGQARQIGQRIQSAVIPGAITDGQVHAAIALPGEVGRMADLARAGVQNARARGRAWRRRRPRRPRWRLRNAARGGAAGGAGGQLSPNSCMAFYAPR